jgi:hypothetical protein
VSGNIGGQTLAPGLYKSTSSLAISSGDLTLDAQGNSNAVWIFQIASTLTTTSGRQVILANGANAANILWQVGSFATIGTTSVFQGNILAAVSITMATGATPGGQSVGDGRCGHHRYGRRQQRYQPGSSHGAHGYFHRPRQWGHGCAHRQQALSNLQHGNECLGAVSNQPVAGVAAGASPLSMTLTSPTVTIGGVGAVVTYSGLAPTFAGLYQINATVPLGASTGNTVPLVISIGSITSNSVTIAVQ